MAGILVSGRVIALSERRPPAELILYEAISQNDPITVLEKAFRLRNSASERGITRP